MKPHRRKKTPPRREQGKEEHAHSPEAPEQVESAPVSEEAPPPMDPDPATYEAPEQPYVDPGEMAYDAGQALSEEPASPYAELEPSTDQSAPASPYAELEPSQDYSTPPAQESGPSYEAYVEPPAEPLADPVQQAYVEPNQAYVDPNQQAYVDPNQQVYADSNQVYAEPPPAAPVPPEPAADAGIYDEVPGAHQRKTKPRKKLTKKKGPVRPPAGGPAARPAGRPPVGPGNPGTYSKPLSTSSGGGISVMTVFLFLSALVMLSIVVAVILPMNLKKVSGYPASPAVAGEARNLLDEGQKLLIARKGQMSLTEEEVNRYLNSRLKGKQEGLMGILVRFDGVYIDFTPGFAEIIVQRRFLGVPITMSARIKGEKFRRQMLYKPAGWSIGKIQFKSRNIKPVIEMFHRLRETMEEEYQVLQLMKIVQFEQDRLVIAPSGGS